MSKVESLEFGIYGKWITDLTDDERYILLRGIAGMNNEPTCLFDKEDIKECGGKREVRKLLSSLKEKAVRIQGYKKIYSDVAEGIKRIESCLG